MRPSPRPALLTLIGIVALAGCTDAGASPSLTATPSATAAGSEAPTTSVPPDSAAPIPSEDLGAFTCDLPIVEDPTVAIANIVDVRAAAHGGYDRVVFEFAQGTPELTFDRATPPFTHDATGEPVAVDGESFLRLTMRGGTKQTDEGTSSYDGPTDLDPALPVLVDLVEGGDFERQSTWYLGLASEACVRVTLLDEPSRLVIDIEAP
jgi:hypothetical protein